MSNNINTNKEWDKAIPEEVYSELSKKLKDRKKQISNEVTNIGAKSLSKKHFLTSQIYYRDSWESMKQGDLDKALILFELANYKFHHYVTTVQRGISTGVRS